MSVADDNLEVFRNSIKGLKQDVKAIAYNEYKKIALRVIHDFFRIRPFNSFTGNTVLSFMAGVYLYGQLDIIYTLTDGLKPLRKKIPRGKRVYLKHPMQGNPRWVVGKVSTTDEYGPETSRNFLMSYQAPKQSHSLVFVVGTEYYSFIDADLYSMNEAFNTTQRLAESSLMTELKNLPEKSYFG